MEQNQNNNLSIAALVCGVVSIVGSFIPYVSYFCVVLAIVAIVLGVKARKVCDPSKKGMATAGLVTGIVGLCWSVVVVICAVCAIAGLAALGAAG